MSGVDYALFIGWPLVLLGVWFGVAYLAAKKVKDEFEQRWTAFTVSPEEGKPSQFALTVQAISRVMADEVKQSLSAAMMGQASAVSKQIQGMEQDVTGDALAAKNPLLAALVNFSPSLRKRLTKNPYAAMALANIDLGSILKGGVKAGGNGHGVPVNSGQSGFELGK